MDAVTRPPVPVNEPVLDYAAGSPERAVAHRDQLLLHRFGFVPDDVGRSPCALELLERGVRVEQHHVDQLLESRRRAAFAGEVLHFLHRTRLAVQGP